MTNFDYKGIKIIYDENNDDKDLLIELLDELFESYYEDLKNIKVMDFTNPDYIIVDNDDVYSYEGGRLEHEGRKKNIPELAESVDDVRIQTEDLFANIDDEESKESKEEPEDSVEEVDAEVDVEPKTFEEKMDFLAKDEQEAIDGYKKIIETIDDEHVKEQLNKILVEEEAHKAYLEKVKEDHSINYEEPLMDDAQEGKSGEGNLDVENSDVESEPKEDAPLEEDLFSKTDPNYYGKKAWLLNGIISKLNDETAYYDTEWLYTWPDGESYEECLEDFNDEKSFRELEDLFISIYKYNDAEEGQDPEDADLNFHRDGLYHATQDIIDLAHEYDKQLGLEPIKVLE